MPIALNETHDPSRKSFVVSANAPGCDFPIQNLPFGIFRAVAGEPPRLGVAIGDQILDVAAAAASFEGLAAEAARFASVPYLNHLMSLGRPVWSALRLALSRGLSTEHGDESLRQHLTPMAQAEMQLPVAVGDFTDFFASIFHASNAGRMFRPDNPLMPNYKYVPVAYHSRAPRRSASAARRSSGRAVSAKVRTRRRRAMDRRAISISSSSSASISAPGMSSANRFRLAVRPSTFSATACSTTGRRAISRPGNINRSVRSWARISPPRSRPGW